MTPNKYPRRSERLERREEAQGGREGERLRMASTRNNRPQRGSSLNSAPMEPYASTLRAEAASFEPQQSHSQSGGPSTTIQQPSATQTYFPQTPTRTQGYPFPTSNNASSAGTFEFADPGEPIETPYWMRPPHVGDSGYYSTPPPQHTPGSPTPFREQLFDNMYQAQYDDRLPAHVSPGGLGNLRQLDLEYSQGPAHQQTDRLIEEARRCEDPTRVAQRLQTWSLPPNAGRPNQGQAVSSRGGS